MTNKEALKDNSDDGLVNDINDMLHGMIGANHDVKIQMIVNRVRRHDKQSEWVSVGDRLPDEPKHYLTIHKNNGMWVDLWHIHKKRFGSVGAEEITHWQPLPEPPK